MLLRLEAIRFNHDTSRATADAFNIRRNETEFVNVPEWRRGLSSCPEDSLAAYALAETRGGTLTVEAQFSCPDCATPELEVRALDARLNPDADHAAHCAACAAGPLRAQPRDLAGNVLGEVASKTIAPCEGKTGFESFGLKDVRIWDAGVGVYDIGWRWQYRREGESDWTDFDCSQHRIYTTLTVPAPPWQQQPHHEANRFLPWAEALERACDWAAGAKDADEAAALITRGVNDLGTSALFYKDSPNYTDDLTFNCQAFLCDLRDQASRSHVNCDDCAAIVSTFANILGCDLRSSSIEPNFDHATLIRVKPIILIGETGWRETHDFNYHAVASEGSCRKVDEVFDACLQVAVEDKPTPKGRIPLLPANLRFGLVGERESFYRSRLVVDEFQDKFLIDPEDCRVKMPAPARRLAPHCQNRLRAVKNRHDFDAWARDDEDAAGPKLFVFKFFFADYLLPHWGALRLRAFPGGVSPEEPPVIQAFWQRTEKLVEDEMLRVDVFKCASRRAAREGLAALLTWFQEPGIRRREMPLLGDVVFADDPFSAVLFAAGNLVFFLRHAGRETGSLADMAESIGRVVRNPPPGSIVTRDEQLFAPGQSHTAVKEVKVGDRVPLLRAPEGSPARERFCQFFTREGEVCWEDGGLVYRPATSGLNTLEIFAADVRGDALRHELRIEVR